VRTLGFYGLELRAHPRGFYGLEGRAHFILQIEFYYFNGKAPPSKAGNGKGSEREQPETS
jgi:hypothetical protein